MFSPDHVCSGMRCACMGACPSACAGEETVSERNGLPILRTNQDL